MSQFDFVFLPLYRACNAKTFDQAGTHKRIGTIYIDFSRKNVMMGIRLRI